MADDRDTPPPAADQPAGGHPGPAPAGPPVPKGLRALGDEQFSLRDVIGGPRGLIESIAPGLVFVVVFIATRHLPAALIASLALAALLVLARLVARSPITQAVSGLGGVVIGVVWAALTGRAQDYFAGGFITNVVILAVAAISLVAGRPVIGYIYGLLTEHPHWRADPALRRRAAWATWPWVILPLSRLLVQWPLYLDGARGVGWLGTARLAMGLPLTALAVYVSWLVLRRPAAAAAAPAPNSPR